MAHILVIENNPDAAALLGLQLRHLGHDPVSALSGHSFELALVEPADERALARVRALRRERPNLPLLFVSIAPPSPETAALRPIAHLVKPVRLAVFDLVLSRALRPPPLRV